MNSNKAALIFARIFNFLFFIIFSVQLLQIIYMGYEWKGSSASTTVLTKKQHLYLNFLFILLTIVIVAGYMLIFRNRRPGRLRPHRDADAEKRAFNALPILFIGVGLMLILQFLVVHQLRCEPVTDTLRIHRYAADFAVTGNFDKVQQDAEKGIHYLMAFPNNHAGLFVVALLYRLQYLIAGTIDRTAVNIFNVLVINGAVLMTVLLARKVFGDKKSILVLAACFLFVPYYTYTAYCYSDSLSLPFTVGAAFVFWYAYHSEKLVKRLLLYVLTGAILFLGYKMKGSVIVMLVAIVLLMIMKLNWKRLLSGLMALVVGFLCVSVAFGAAVRAANFATPEQQYDYEWPMTHWVMMGLTGFGGYNQEDSDFTASIIGKDEKKEANLEVIKERLESYSIVKFLYHLTRKSTRTWEDSTYYISHHIEEYIERSPLHDYVLNDGEHHYRLFAISCAFHLFLILMMILSALKGMLRPRCDMTLLFRLAVFGIYLFLLIWETRSRYLFNFTPFFLLLGMDGLQFTGTFLHSLWKTFGPLQTKKA